MKSYLLVFVLFTGVLSAQIVNPAYVISNSAAGVKNVLVEERSEFKDFRIAKISAYDKRGFTTGEIQYGPNGDFTTTSYFYDINEDDSTMVVTRATTNQAGAVDRETYNYQFSGMSLWESKPTEGNQTVVDYKHYKYDENWNLITMHEVQVIGADTNVVKRYDYTVQTDVFHKLVSTSHSEIGSRIDYYYDEDGVLLSKAIFDGPVKRTTEHRLYNENNQLQLSVEVLNRGGALMGIKRYSYKRYRKGKTSVFEKWMPVAHPESVMEER